MQPIIKTSGFLILMFIHPYLIGQNLFENNYVSYDSSHLNQPINFSAYLKSSYYGPGENYDFSSLASTVSIKGYYKKGQNSIFTDARLNSGWVYNEYINNFDLREAYFCLKLNRLKISVGQQITKWGRLEAYGPLEYISPLDYFYHSAEADDAYMGNFMFNAKLRLNSKIQFQILLIPVYKSSSYRYDLLLSRQNAEFIEAFKHSIRFENASLAGKLNFNLELLEFSISAFHGFDPFSAYGIENIYWTNQHPSLSLQVRPYKKTSFGMDFESRIASFIFRSEIAWNMSSQKSRQMHVPDPNFHFAFNLETSISGWITMAQYIGKYSYDRSKLKEPSISNPHDPNEMLQYFEEMIYYESLLMNRKIFQQQKELNHALFLNLQKSFLYEDLDLNFFIYYNITSKEILLRPKAKYKFSPNFSVQLGYNYMYGPDEEIFDMAASLLNNAFIELKYQF